MNFQIITEAGDILPYLALLPEELKQQRLFAEINTFLSVFGAIVHQSLPLSGFTILHHAYYIKDDTSLYKRLESPLLVLHVIYKNNLHYTDIEGIGKIKFHEGQFNFIYLPYVNAKMKFEKGEYTTFCIHFSKEYLEDFISYLPTLEKFLENADNNKASLLSESNVYSSHEMMEVIDSILNAENHDELNDLYIEGKVQELLILAIKKLKKTKKHKYFLSQNDTEQIEKLKEWLNENMSNPGTLREMARRFGINVVKLNRGFQQVFETTVFDHILKMRLEKAKKLLLESNFTITEIAYEVGYSRVSTFTRAFRKYFKYAPNYLRKK